ncbi:FUSC family protein [Legionella sp. WA2022007384]
MFKIVDYRKARALQICLVFSTALAVQSVLGYSHAGWIGFAVMMIYAGFDRGASLQRTTHRFWGAVLGLLLSYMLWFIGQIDFRFILIIIPVIVFMAYFSLGKRYAFPTIFTVTLTSLGTDYYGRNNYAVPNFFFDYLLSTIVAFLLCFMFETLVFRNSQLSRKFYIDLQKRIITHLNKLFDIVTQKPLRDSIYLKESIVLNTSMLDLYAFVDAAKHERNLDVNFANELDSFGSVVQQAYHNIRRLFVLGAHRNEILKIETRSILEQLTRINQSQRIKYIGE